MSDPYLGEIQAFPIQIASGGFNGPSGSWLPCFGQLLPIRQNTALFSLIGTAYGGDGQTTFALPNLMGCVTNSQGAGAGLQLRVLGETMGSMNETLMSQEMASHTHALQMGAAAAQGAAAGPGTGANMAAIAPALFNGFVPPPSNTTLAPNTMALTGGAQPHNNAQPTQAVVWCIAIAGTFPSFG